MDNSPNAEQRKFVVGLLTIGLLIIVFFGWRTVRAFREFHVQRPPPPFATKAVETDVDLIRDWMTVPFVSKMYHVPPDILFEALGISPQENQEKSLKRLNEEFYPRAEGLMLEKIKAAILTHQSTLTAVPSSTSLPTGSP